ncbi:hypothetical protein FQZ97_1025120 [compost metagenome]
MQRCLGCRIDRRHGHWHEAEHRGDVDDDRIRFGPQMLDQRRGHADRPKQVCGDGQERKLIVHRTFGMIEQHDAGIVDQHVELRVIGSEVLRCCLDAGRVVDVEFKCGHAGVGVERLLQPRLATSGDDHLIAEFVEGFCQTPANAGAAASDEDRVASHAHEGFP